MTASSARSPRSSPTVCASSAAAVLLTTDRVEHLVQQTRSGRRPAPCSRSAARSAAARRRGCGRTGTAGPRPRRPRPATSARFSSASRATMLDGVDQVGSADHRCDDRGRERCPGVCSPTLPRQQRLDQSHLRRRRRRWARPGAWSSTGSRSAAWPPRPDRRPAWSGRRRRGRRPPASNLLTTVGERVAAGGAQTAPSRRVSMDRRRRTPSASSSSRNRSTVAACAAGSATCARTSSSALLHGLGAEARRAARGSAAGAAAEPAVRLGP